MATYRLIRTPIRRATLAAASLWLLSPASADDFNFEVSASFDAERLSTAIPLFGGFPGIPDSTAFLDTDSDTVAVAGSWYFAGASDSNGPLSRAVFLSRASSVSFSYRRIDLSSDFSLNPPPELPSPSVGIDPLPGLILIPAPVPAPNQFGFDGDEYSIGGRYVWTESGWYLFGTATFGDGGLGNGPTGVSIENRQLSAGGGVYLGERTALELSLQTRDIDISFGDTQNDDSATDVAISITHIGNLGSTWQFGIDAAFVSRDSGDAGTASALRGSLYPTRRLAFGLEIETDVEAFFDSGTRYELFGSWFITPKFEVFGSYGQVDLDAPPESSVDLELFSLGLLGRF